MSKKGTTYLLIAGVSLLWGFIIFQLVSSLGNSDQIIVVKSGPKKREIYNDYQLKKDTTRLALNYRDPFGLVRFHDTISSAQTSSVSKHNGTITGPLPDWSRIKYSGYIANPKSDKVISIISVNGKNMMMTEGETENDFKLIKNMRDSVKVKYKNTTGYISRN